MTTDLTALPFFPLVVRALAHYFFPLGVTRANDDGMHQILVFVKKAQKAGN